MEKINSKPVAIVTGGSKGIGRAISIEFAKSGYHVIVNYRSDDKTADELIAHIKAGGGSGEKVKFDVKESAASDKAINDIISRYETINVLVNNAGIISDELFVMMTAKKWDAVIDTTLKGFFNVTRPVLQKMVKQKKGAIVSISSAAGLMANKGQANYSAAKAGLIGASRTISSEVARLGIRVNVVAPGLIETNMIKDVPIADLKNMIPMARIGKPDEVAKVVKFLCSDDASYITGQVISVNGGMF
ncbi:MAG: 3-oxoacyl-ACP reductase FabG [Desulfobacterales bacterium]|nr:3-oxoacyl-ACP reductase FabG [Desulfobacterales bacterium]